MNWLVYHFASGGAFFSGLAFIFSGAVLGSFASRWSKSVGSLTCVIGVVAIAISGTPLAIWFYALSGGVVVFWLASLRSAGRIHKFHRAATVLLFVVLLVAVTLELPYHLTPVVPRASADTLVVFGDSITAGIDGHSTETWPQLIARTKALAIHDYSQMGATVSVALKKARQIEIPDGIILLEIGGNDLLAMVRPADFGRNLDALMAHVSGEGRHIVMFELPLPPFCNSFGRVQRSLAAKYDATLVPKRYLVDVISSENATLDSLHLSQHGHEKMAECVWQLLAPQ